MEKRLEQIEKSDFKAESLADVLSLDEDEGESLRAVFSATGQIEAVRVGKRVPLPSTTEELRSRMSLWGTSWVMAATLHTHRSYLKDVTPQLFDRYVGYLLGKFVLGLVTCGPPGSPVSAPSWQAVLNYDHEVRKAAMKFLLTGSTLSEALQRAMDDPVVRERSFTTPLALAHLKRGRDEGVASGGGEGGVSKRQKTKLKAEAKKGERDQSQKTGGAQGSQGGQAGQKGMEKEKVRRALRETGTAQQRHRRAT